MSREEISARLHQLAALSESIRDLADGVHGTDPHHINRLCWEIELLTGLLMDMAAAVD